MSIFDWFRRPAPAAQTPAPLPPAAPPPVDALAHLSFSPEVAALMGHPVDTEHRNPFEPAKHAPGVLPSGQGMAMDDALPSWGDNAVTAISPLLGGRFNDLLFFLGFPFLAELAQRPEYRRMSEIIALESTRMWIKISATGEDDKAEKITQLAQSVEKFKCRDVLRKEIEQDGFFGRGHIYIDTGASEDDAELKMPLGNPRDKTTKLKFKQGDLQAFRNVEPMWCAAIDYNTTNPLMPHWYKPQAWYVMGRKVHASRLLTLVTREVPDILKPAYSFAGVSLSQLARPYVDNWLHTRTSVARLISSFSVSGIKIGMRAALQGDSSGAGLLRRIAMFNNYRNNSGTMVLDKGNGKEDPPEEFFNVSVPLGTLDVLQSQTQEHMAAIAGIPLVKLLGVTPAGLNASSDGEIRIFYDWIHAQQEAHVRPILTTMLDFIQLNEFGEIDPDITFSFEPLWSMSEKDKAEVAKIEADTDMVYVEGNVLQQDEVRTRLAGDPEGAYPGLDLSVSMNEPDLDETDSLPDVPKPSDETER